MVCMPDRVLEIGFGMNVRDLPGGVRHVLQHVLERHELIAIARSVLNRVRSRPATVAILVVCSSTSMPSA